MRIGIDIDNTLFHFDASARDVFLMLAEERRDKSLFRGAYSPWTEWRSLSDACGQEIADEVIEHVHQTMPYHPPFPGSVAVVTALAEAGHVIEYLSTRDPQYQLDTEYWLIDNKFPYGLVFCSWEDKQERLRRSQILIDDRPKTIIEFVYSYQWKNRWGSENSEKQRKAFSLAWPYNSALTDIPNVYLAPTWAGIRYYLVREGVLNGDRSLSIAS